MNHANDNAYAFGRPLVRTLRRRPGVTYARSGNVILPLQFAERSPGWSQPAGALSRSARLPVEVPAPNTAIGLDGPPTIRQGSPASET